MEVGRKALKVESSNIRSVVFHILFYNNFLFFICQLTSPAVICLVQLGLYGLAS